MSTATVKENGTNLRSINGNKKKSKKRTKKKRTVATKTTTPTAPTKTATPKAPTKKEIEETLANHYRLIFSQIDAANLVMGRNLSQGKDLLDLSWKCIRDAIVES